MQRILHAASHLALWAGLYVVGAVSYVNQVSGMQSGGRGRTALSLVFAGLTAAAVYLLDRVKLRDRWLDPADDASHPARHRFLAARTRRVRWLAAVLLVAGIACGAAVSPVLPVLGVFAVAGVSLYAGRPRHHRPRVKDVLLLKNLYVAAGIAAFALVVGVCAAPMRVWWPWEGFLRMYGLGLSLAGLTLAVRVVADAALCDIDDETADREFGTDTLPTRLGRQRAWAVAMGMRLAAAAALWWAPAGNPPAAHAWAVATLITTFGLRAINPRALRDLVDLRLPFEALGVGLWLMARA